MRQPTADFFQHWLLCFASNVIDTQKADIFPDLSCGVFCPLRGIKIPSDVGDGAPTGQGSLRDYAPQNRANNVSGRL